MSVVEIDDQNFEKEIASSKKRIVLVDFWAPWCGPCKHLAPILEEIDQKVGHYVKIVKINIAENPRVADRLGVMALPTLLAFIRGKQVAKLVGLQSQEKLLKWLKEINGKNIGPKRRRKKKS